MCKETSRIFIKLVFQILTLTVLKLDQGSSGELVPWLQVLGLQVKHLILFFDHVEWLVLFYDGWVLLVKVHLAGVERVLGRHEVVPKCLLVGYLAWPHICHHELNLVV